jgi:hypothetical protein
MISRGRQVEGSRPAAQSAAAPWRQERPGPGIHPEQATAPARLEGTQAEAGIDGTAGKREVSSSKPPQGPGPVALGTMVTM